MRGAASLAFMPSNTVTRRLTSAASRPSAWVSRVCTSAFRPVSALALASSLASAAAKSAIWVSRSLAR